MKNRKKLSVMLLLSAWMTATALGSSAAELQRTGRNIFFDERNTLVDCCRKGAYLQARDKIRSASREELTEAISELIRNGRYKPEENFSLLCEMYSIGGSIDPDLLETYAGTKGQKRPDAMKKPESYTEMIRDLLRNTVTDSGRWQDLSFTGDGDMLEIPVELAAYQPVILRFALTVD